MADAQTVIRALVALEPAGGDHITTEQGDEIARLFDGDFGLFRQLDEGPGRYRSSYYHGGADDVYSYDGWHWKLRQARNDGANNFFTILSGEMA